MNDFIVDFDELFSDMTATATEIDPSEEEVCKGLFFRGHHSVFFNYKQGRLSRHEELRLLKRMSCKGCRQCLWLLEDLKDAAYMDIIEFPNYGIENNKIYTIVPHFTRDWKSGVEELDCISIVEMKE